jgi:hypothetical protein
MDNKKRELLRHHQQAIVKDLDVEYVADELYSKYALTNEDFEELYKKVSQNFVAYDIYSRESCFSSNITTYKNIHHHHQPINIPTARHRPSL